jgi:putative ABC transport system permease protein
MKRSRNLRLSLEILAAHKLRTLLSTSGIVVGVAAVVIMVATGRGAERSVLERIQAMGTDLLVVNAGQALPTAGRQRQATAVTTLTPADAEAIVEASPSVLRAAGAQSKKMTVRWEEETANTTVLGLAPSGFGIRNIRLAAGRAYDEAEERGMRRVATVGPTVVANLFHGRDPIGAAIRIGRVPFEVVGLAAPKGVDQNGVDQDDVIYIPLATAMRRVLNVTYVTSIYVQAYGSGALDAAEADIRALLRERHRLDRADKRDDFTIENQATILAAERGTARTMTSLVGSVAAISLLVGGIGILAVMLISIRERRHEIGLRRALGAKRRDVASQFLAEALIVAAAGGAAGLLVGVGGAYAVARFGAWAAVLSWEPAALALGASAAIGTLFGFYPALQAAGLEPIDALRAE